MSWGHINVKYTVAANVCHIKHQISRDLKGWIECAFYILSYNLSTQVMLKLSFYTDTFWRDTQIKLSIQHFWNFQMRNVADMIAKLCHHLPCTLKEVMRTFWNCVWLRKIRYASLLFPNSFIVYQLLLQNAGVFSVCVLDFLSSLVALQLSSSHPVVHGHHSCKQ